MVIEKLKELGLTSGEVKVYDALLSLGSSTTGRIVKESGVSASKVYIILGNLARKGLAKHVMKSGVRNYSATSPTKLLELVEEKEIELKKEKEIAKSLVPLLLSRRKFSDHEAYIYEGYKGIKSYFREKLEEGSRERLVFGASMEFGISPQVTRFFKQFDRDRAKKGVKLKIIFNESAKGTEQAVYYESLTHTEVRYLKQHGISSIGVQKDAVDILVWSRDVAVLFVIKSADVAGTFREQFEVLWKAGKGAK